MKFLGEGQVGGALGGCVSRLGGRDHRSGQLHHYTALCQPDSGMGGMEKRGFVLRRLDVMLARGKERLDVM